MGVTRMATLRLKGMDEYISRLNKLTAHTEDTMKRAVYAGADKIADAVRLSMVGIPVQDEYVNKGEMRTGVKAEDKEKIQLGLGIAKIRNESGSVNTKVGFARGVVGMARKVESGTSYMQKYPFVRRAVNKARQAAMQEMAKVFDEETKKLMR